MILAPGARLGRYEILSLPGRGGMGEVYKARDSRLDRFVAAPDQQIMSVTVGSGPGVVLSAARPLLKTNALFPGSIFRMTYDVTADGQRVLVNNPVQGAGKSPITVVMNWTVALTK